MGAFPHSLVGMWDGVATMENSMEVSLKTKKRVSVRPNSPTPGHISRKDENSNFKKYMHPKVLCSTIYNSQDM